MSLFFVDCEAFGGCPALGRLTWFGIVQYPDRAAFDGKILSTRPDSNNPAVPERVEVSDSDYYTRYAPPVYERCREWLGQWKGRPIFVSDNPAFDFQWINDGFLRTIGVNPFGHSARRLSDFYAGLRGDFYKTQAWKRLRVTPHDHNPVNDAMGNLEAFERLLAGER